LRLHSIQSRRILIQEYEKNASDRGPRHPVPPSRLHRTQKAAQQNGGNRSEALREEGQPSRMAREANPVRKQNHGQLNDEVELKWDSIGVPQAALAAPA